MLSTNKLMNQDSEYWYIGSMRAKSVMQKYKIEPRIATTLYSCLVASISQHCHIESGMNMCTNDTLFILFSFANFK